MTTTEYKISLNDIIAIVPVFNGKPGDLPKFLACGDILFKSVKTDAEHKMFLSIVKTRLEGPAFELIQYKTVEKWDDLQSILKKEYTVVKSRSSAQNELLAARQRVKESIKEFGDRISQLLNSLNSATYSSSTEEAVRDFLFKENDKLAIQTFEDGIRNQNLRFMVQAHGETDLKKSIAYAEEHSNRLERVGPSTSSNHTHQYSNYTPSTRPTCQFCKRIGHSSENCFTNPNRKNSSPNPIHIKKEVQRLTCGYCKRPNHQEVYCRLKRSQANPNPQNPFRDNSHNRSNENPTNVHQYNVRPGHTNWSSGEDFYPQNSGNAYVREEEMGHPSRIDQNADPQQ